MSWSGSCARGLFACVLLSLLAGPPAIAQPGTPQATAYLSLLQRYESGDYEGAAKTALTLNPAAAHELGRLVIIEDIKDQMVLLQRLKAATPEAPTGDRLNQLRRERLRRLKLSLLVHTEAALRVTAPGPLGDQLTLARGLVTLLRDLVKDEWEGHEGFVRDWYLVVASHLQAADQPRYLKEHVTSGLGLFGDDPELLLARGSISEGEADISVVDRSLARDIYTSDFIQRWRQFMTAAGGDYKQAERHQPDLHEATLRWGRINSHLGDRKAARRALVSVASSEAPVRLKYLARIFLGELSEAEQQPAAAVDEYNAAHDLIPTAQAPMLALSQLCDATAQPDCARRWLSQSMAATGPGQLDPWWDYQFGQAWLGDQRLATFRARGLQK